MKIKSNIFWLPFVLLITKSCSIENSDKNRLESVLGIKLSKDITEIKYSKALINSNYDYPYIIYSKFKVPNDSIFFGIIKDLGLIENSKSFEEKMCLGKVDEGFVSSLTRFETIRTVSQESKIIPIWWDVPLNMRNEDLYLGFYLEQSKLKIVPCYTDKWDGRILCWFSFDNKTAYFFIEVFMK